MPQVKDSPPGNSFAQDVLQGLSQNQKYLLAKYFYDELGSELFEEITRQPEYYPTRTEKAILHEIAPELSERLGHDVSLVELGSGSSAKTIVVLESLLESQGDLHYLPIDISPIILKETAERLDARFPSLDVTPIASQYESGLSRAALLVSEDEEKPNRKLVLFLGSSIGNLEPQGACSFLRGLRAQLKLEDALLIGFDLQKDVDVLERAYNDGAGVTARFNLNILTRINRELDASFELEDFEHRADYNEPRGRVEMHLKSRREHRVPVDKLNRSFAFAPGETIHTENSYKYTRAQIESYAIASGFRLGDLFTDERDWFGLALFYPD